MMRDPERERELERRLRLYAKRARFDPGEAERAFTQLARPEDLDELLRRVPAEFSEALRAAAARFRPVRGIGYWRDPDSRRKPEASRFPDPRRLVGGGLGLDDRAGVVAYLRAGRTYVQWRGVSWCRFRCGVGSGAMGSRCLTDGAWVWPEGLAHYIEAHDVRLPEDFLESIRGRDPRPADDEDVPTYDRQGPPDFDFWIAWADRAAHRPWWAPRTRFRG